MSLGRVCAAVFVLLVASAGSAAACSCMQTTFEDSFRNAALVFEGTAVSTRRVDASEATSDSDDQLVTTFKVTRPIKGAGFETREIRHAFPDGGNCGMSFGIGAAYRVYAYGRAVRFFTGACSRTGPLGDRDLFRTLNPEAPVPGKTLEDVIRQIRDPKLTDREAKLLFFDYEYREEEEKEESFIRRYISWAESATKGARRGDVGGYSGAIEAAAFYESWGDYERAAEIYALLEKAAPKDVRGPAGRGRALVLAGHASLAIPHLERAIRLEPEHREARVFLARARLLAGGVLTPDISDYRGVSLRTIVISGAHHAAIDLSGATIVKLSAKGARLPRAKFGSVSIGEADFHGADLTEANFVGARITHVNFSRAILRNAYMIDAFLEHADFSGGDLRKLQARGSEFHWPDFRGSRLENAGLARTSLYKANFEGADLGATDLGGANLMNALLQGADLRGAKLGKAKLTGARIDCRTQLPEKFDVKKAGLIPVQSACDGRPQNRDFSNRNWTGADFSQLDLSGATFANSEFGFIYGDAGFPGAKLVNANFSGTKGSTSFAGADLTNADFSRSEIKGSFHGRTKDRDDPGSWPPAKLTGTNFSGAKLETSSFIGPRFLGPLPKRARYEAAKFPGARLKCSLGDWAEIIERKAGEKVEPDDPSRRYGPLWDSLSEIERELAIENARKMHMREVEQRRHEAAFVQAEREMVTFLRKKWPSMTFDKSCAYYLAAADAGPGN